MNLTKLEREVIIDSMLKVQSIQASLDRIDGAKLPDNDEIQSCLKIANKSFRAALRAERTATPQKKHTKQ